jgi:hypothetical protein
LHDVGILQYKLIGSSQRHKFIRLLNTLIEIGVTVNYRISICILLCLAILASGQTAAQQTYGTKVNAGDPDVGLSLSQFPLGSASGDAKAADTNAELGLGSSPNINLELVSDFEGGRLYKAGKFNVVVLNGSYREMGRQYGGLLGPQIKSMYEETLNTTPLVSAILNNKDDFGGTKCPGVSVENVTFQSFARDSFQLYPKRFQEMIIGISETSGVPVDEIYTINEFISYFLWWWVSDPDALSHPAAEPQGLCTAITAWGNYTGGHPLVMGRNVDLPSAVKNFDKYITVVVFNPNDGSNSAATVAYAGMVGALQAFNEAGLVLECNDASSSGDINRPLDRVPFMVRDVQFMFDYSTLAGLDAAMKSSRIFHPLIYNAANQSEAYCYETATFDVQRRGGIDGLLVGANHFIIPDWGRDGVLTNSSLDSLSRHQNMTDLGNKYKGKINSSVMMAILDTPRKMGGVTWTNETIYQFIAVPEQRRIWLKAPGFEDWREVDLGALFN